MCIGIPGRVVEPTDRPDIARVDVDGIVREVNMALLEDDPPTAGEWVMIHLGFALERMTDDEARSALETMATLAEGEMPDLFADETVADESWATEPRRIRPSPSDASPPTVARGAS